MAAITLDIGGNTRRLDRDIQKTVNRVYSINLKTKGDQPLGRITGKVNEFTKSLDASNARVIAFGASAGIIFGVQRAFAALVSSTIEVQKSLQDINVILNVSTQNLQKFGASLFDIAKNTGQSFQEVAKAATEFSRQGLGVEETLKRTNEALILSRLSGLDAAKSVEALTAAVNSYASQAVTATEVVNKFANVDAAFAVSSADLAEALARVGSSAAQSGVSLNELIAIVTSAQQTTARGGAVIGNSFKTIFTRLQRGKVVNLLGSLGISETDSSGQLKSTIQLLQDLGKVYDTLGARQQAAVAEQVGGVFQINILKAALADLGKEYSIYSSALNVAAGTTDQAIRRNEELNKTYAAQLNALQENARQLAAAGGERLLGPSIDRLVGGTNTLLSGFSEADGQGVGAILGKGILDGLGQFIAGPGIALIGGVLLKLFRDLAKFATGSVQQLLGLNTAATQQRDLQTSIQQILSKNPKLIELATKGEQGLNAAANSLLANLQKQTVELQKQAQIAQQISKAFISQAGVRVAGGVPVVPTKRPGKAAGYIPNFAEEFQAKELGATSNVKAVRGVGKIGGKSFEANNQELQIRNFANTGETAVIPKYGNGIKEATNMIAKGQSGSILDKSDRNRAKGFIPNFANTIEISRLASVNPRISKNIKGNLEADDTITSTNIRSLFFENVGNQTGKKYEVEALKYLNSVSGGGFVDSKSLKYGKTSAIDAYRVKGNQIDLAEFKGGRFLNQLILNKILRGIPENYGTGNPLDTVFKEGVQNDTDDIKVGGYLVQSSKKNQKEVGSKFSEKNVIKARAAERISKKKFYEKLRGAASGFIPNFAQTKNPPIQLGNLDKAPNKLGKKVLSLIYPGLSGPYELAPATATYLKQQYTGNIPVAGINEKKLKSQIPDLDKNVDDFLVRQANQFGQSLGGFNFLKSADELPNAGAAKGAVGVAFEGGITTLLQNQVRKQNAGIDFRKISPRLKSIFNDAPGIYDAKRSPALTNEVLQKLLNETKPGATVQKTSGAAGAAYLKQRSAAVEQLRKEGVTGSVAIRQALKDRFGIVGKAAGHIPNFAAIQDAISREQDAGIPKNQIYLAQEKALTSANPMGIGVFNKRDEPTKRSRKDAMRRKGFAKGYVPNFAIEDPDVQGASAGTATAAIISQITGIAFAFAFTGNQFKDSLKELTAANQQAGKVQKEISAKQKRDFFDEEKRLRGRVGAEGRANERAQQAQFAPGGLQKTGAFLRSNALGLSIAAPILGETLKNIAGQETPGRRQFGEVASGAGQIASFGATGALIAKGGGPIGLAIGALLTIPNVVNAFTTELPELTAAAKKASQDLTKFSDASQRILTASSSISEFTDKGASPEKLKKVQDDLAKALSELTPAERSRIESSIRLGGLEEELAKITQERIEQEQLRAKAVSVRAIAEKGFTRFSTTLDTTTSQGQLDEQTLRDVFKGFFTGKTPEETLENFNKAAKSGVPQLQNLIQSVAKLDRDLKAGTAGRRNLYGTLEGPDFTQIFTNILEESIPQGKTADEQEARSRFIKDFVDIASNNITNFQNAIQVPFKTLTRDKQSLEEGIASSKRATDSQNVFNKVKEKYSGILENSISSLNRTISVFNSLANALDQFQVSAKSFERERGVAQGFTLPKNVAETVLGTEAELTRRAALFEKIAQNETARLDAIDKSNLGFREDFRGNLNEVFTERLKEIQTLRGADAKTIPEQAALTEEVLKAQKLFESGAIDINNILEDSFKDGLIDSDKFKTDLRAAFENADFKSSETEKILDGILKVSEQQNVNLLSINQNAEQQNIRAGQEFANEKILLDIRRSLKVFGGTQTFLQPSEEGIVKPLQTLIQSATSQLKTQREFEFAKRTGVGTSFGTEKQVQNNIALGQSTLSLIKQLQEASGGAFTPDPGSELYRRATAGLAQSFENNIKQLNDILKNPKVDQAFKAQIKATLEAIGGLGSSKEIAELQIAQETGSAFQSTLEGALSRLQDPAIQQLRDAGLPDLANEIARNAQFTADPIVNVLNVQKTIQASIVTKLEDISNKLNNKEIRETGVTPIPGGVSVTAPTTQARGFIPAFNKERQAISRGVGGAKAGDRPQFIPNLNGSPAFVNSGERLVDNYGGSGQTAVLTRDMQEGMAEGFIPNFALWDWSKNKKLNKIYQELQERAVRGDLRALAEAERMVAKQAFESKFTTTVFRGDDLPYTDYTSKLGRKGGGAGGGALGKGLYAASTERYADLFGAKASYPVGGGPPIDRWRQGNADIMSGVTRKFYTNAKPVQLTDEVFDFADEFQKPFLAENKRLQEISNAAIDRNRQLLSIVPTPSNYVANFEDLPEVKAYNKYRDKVQEATNVAIRKKFSANAISATNYGVLAQPGETEYALTRSNQLKLADTFTYDDKGKLIPLSKRFDKGPDVRGKVGKGLGKSIAKKLPLISIAAGLGFGASRAFSGDFLGAGLEVASGVAGTFPGPGTAGSIAIDAALFARDLEEISPNQKPLRRKSRNKPARKKKKIQTKAEGFLPSLNKESRAIARGVGGAKAGDRPQFIPNLNGSPAFVNTGEKLVDNYGGSGKTAVLTREMQNAMVAAKGFIPNFAEKIIDPNQNIISTGRRALNQEILDKKLSKYRRRYNQAKNFDSIQLDREAYEILSKLKSELEEDAKYYNLNRPSQTAPSVGASDPLNQYFGLRQQIFKLHEKLRRGLNPDIQESPQDPEFLRFLEEQKNKPPGVGASVAPTIGSQVAEAIVNATMGDTVARATAVNQEDLYSDAFIRAASVTAELGKYTGLNLGTNNALGKAGEKPKVKIKPQKGGGANSGPFVYGLSEFVDFYDKNPGVDAFFNEATHVNQNLVPGRDTLKELEAAEQAIKDNGGPNQYLEKLKRLADFIEQQNQTAQQKFVKITRVPSQASYDQRRFDTSPKGFVRAGSEEGFSSFDSTSGPQTMSTRYIQERTSTLNEALSKGIASGEINAEELGLLGIPLDVAKNIVAETIAIDRQLKEQKPDQPSRPVTKPQPVPGTPPVEETIPSPKATRATPQEIEAERQRIQKESIDKRIEESRRKLEIGRGLLGESPSTPLTPTKPKSVTPPPAVPGIPTAVPEPKPAIPKAATVYPGGISQETARAIVQELDTTYNKAISQQRNPQIAKSWAQTQQRYRLLYSSGKYAELDAFYKALKKGPGYNQNYGQGTGRPGESVQNLAMGFIPNFAKDYISNLAGLEAGLSGEDPVMGYDKKIGSFMYNKAQSRSGNLNEIIAKDHPEGLKAAMKNSMKMQKSVGVMNKGFVPNFAATDQSFTQLESSFSANTSALTSLAGGIESLNSTLSNFEANFANLNNAPGTQPAGAQGQAGAQPNVTTTTNAPVNVVVNAQGGNDIAAAVGEAVQNAIPTIIDKVKVALGQKVPPTSQ